MNSKKAKLLVFATILSTFIYLIWRIFYTMPVGYGMLSMCLAMILLLAEITGMFEQIVHFYNMKDKEKPELPEVDEADFPDVDVFIATYNEPVELLYKTVNGCVTMKYPDKKKVRIFLCDDGGREQVKALADHFGIGYFAREDHQGAKAGNLNYALERTSGALIVTFDADMIPMSDFLMATVPYFIGKEKVGFIQTPQSFYNLDLFQYNLYSEETIPNEQDYFYRDIQLAKNKSNSVIYGGSNTVIAREALNEIGGFVTSVITEDFATGMLIQSKGYSCYATDEVHASGLSPEDLTNLIKQRRRWARGCIQTGRKLHVLFQKGLSFTQKISYINSISYWYSSIKRLVYILSPIVYSVFGITVLVASPLSLFVFWLPMYVLNAKALKYLSGNIRTTRWTNIYETIFFPLLLKDVLLEIFGISEKKFAVTKKGSREEERSYLRYAIPHIFLAVLTAAGLLNCFHIIFTTGNVSILFLVFWLILNLYNLSMAIFFMLGRKSFRQYERFVVDASVSISFGYRTFRGKTYDISEGGFSIVLECPDYMPPEEAAKIQIKADGYEVNAAAKIVQVLQIKEGYKYAFSFEPMEESEYQQLLLLLHDRVPPLTQAIKDEYGFFEDLRINLTKRYEKVRYYNRKLPRIQLDYELFIDEDTKVTLLSFNYEYMAVKMDRDKESKPLMIDFGKGSKSLLEYEKDLSYYELAEFERGRKIVRLYRVANLEQVIRNPEIARTMLELQKRSEKRSEERRASERKAQIEVEYNEMELL